MICHSKKISLLAILILGLICVTSCSGVDSPSIPASQDSGEIDELSLSDEKSNATVHPTSTIDNELVPSHETPITPENFDTSSEVILPIKRQVPPSDIQRYVTWSDGGAQSGVGCKYITPSDPIIWTEGEFKPGSKITLYYDNFVPYEEIKTAWYAELYRADYEKFHYTSRADYLTSWIVKADSLGKATQEIFIPQNFCIPWRSIVIAFGAKIPCKQWAIRPSWTGIDILASANTELIVYEDEVCSLATPPSDSRDSSLRFLEHINQGILSVGELHNGGFDSFLEAHRWRYQAKAGNPFWIDVNFQGHSTCRVSIFDPTDQLVYENGGNWLGDCQHGIEYYPESSGYFDIFIDIDRFDESDKKHYSISIASCDSKYEKIIDDASTNLKLGHNEYISFGSEDADPTGWRIAPYGYQGSTRWTYCTDSGPSNWAEWNLDLFCEGRYEIFVFVPEHQAGTKQAKYKIFHNDEVDEVTIRQYDYANEWVSLGVYDFAAEGEEYVYLDDNTGEPRSSDITIAFDAIKFVYIP